MGKSTESEPGTKQPNLSMNHYFFGACTTRHLDKHYSQASVKSTQWFLRCDNKKNPRWPMVAMFVNELEFFIGTYTTRHSGEQYDQV